MDKASSPPKAYLGAIRQSSAHTHNQGRNPWAVGIDHVIQDLLRENDPVRKARLERTRRVTKERWEANYALIKAMPGIRAGQLPNRTGIALATQMGLIRNDKGRLYCCDAAGEAQ